MCAEAGISVGRSQVGYGNQDNDILLIQMYEWEIQGSRQLKKNRRITENQPLELHKTVKMSIFCRKNCVEIKIITYSKVAEISITWHSFSSIAGVIPPHKKNLLNGGRRDRPRLAKFLSVGAEHDRK